MTPTTMAAPPAGRRPADAMAALRAFNRTAVDLPAGRGLYDLFHEQARRRPDAVALVFRDEPVTFAALRARADAVAAGLRARGVGPEVRVALCLERGPDSVACMLGVLRAGGAFVPLDPAYPPVRLAQMIDDAGASVVVTQPSLRPLLPEHPAAVVEIDGAGWPRGAAEGTRDAAPPAHPRGLAYVVFTSGSTGVPKGIAVEHAGVTNNLLDWNRRFGIGEEDRSLFVSSVSFDISVFETLGVLAAGGAVVVPTPDELRDPAAWVALMRRHGVTVWNSATALLGMLADQVDRHPQSAPGSLRLAFAGGDRVPPALVRRLASRLPSLRVVVLGGVTEVSIYSTSQPADAADPAAGVLPYGTPMGNQRAYVLDPSLRPALPGETGEMYLGGAGVTRGYVGRPGFTAERFLPDPCADLPGARMYRTGDGARWRADGALDFLGRLDQQVKIRGNRVEPGEVEAVLARHPDVLRCAVAPRADAGGDLRLVAWVVGGARPDVLREHVRDALPDYMVPSAFVAVDALPLSPNGKVNRAALPAPDFGAGGAPYEPPRSPVEQVLAAVWAEVLPAERVGAGDHFFDMGGDSVRAMRLVAHVQETYGVDLPFRDVLAVPVLRTMAAEIERRLHDDILRMTDAEAERLLALTPLAGETK